jgi:hypothetical protein
MDLIEYLTSYKKGKQIRKKKIRKDRIARRARGFGQRHRAYRENNNKSSEIDNKILALLTLLTKQNQPQIQTTQALNPFIEKEKQTYSMTFEPKVKSLEERLSQIEQKQITMGEVGEAPVGEAPESPQLTFLDTGLEQAQNLIQQQEQKAIELATIHNEFVDYENKWNEVIEKQESLSQVLDDIPIGNMNENAQEEFRLENVEIKENVLSLQNQLQEELNEAKDLNDYKEFIVFQKKVLDTSINNFVSVDNRLADELVKGKDKLSQEAVRLDEEQKAFEKLQEQTFNEKREIEKQNELLNLELVKSKEKESDLMNELNSTTSQLTKLKDKVYQMETNPEKAKSPTRVEVEEVELPKPEPTEEELKKQREVEEALRVGREEIEKGKKKKEELNKKNTQILLDMVKKDKYYSESMIKAVKELFGEETHQQLVGYGKQGAKARKTKIKQLLQEKRGVEF